MAGAVVAAAVFGGEVAAHGDPAPTVAGYTLDAQALGFQFACNIPGLVPLPNENLVEDDVPFARTTAGSGPLVDALGAPYYPGDIAANVGTLLQTFGVPLPVPNDSALAEAKYPPSPGYASTATFGAPPPAGSPATPNVFDATSQAGATGGQVTSSVSDLTFDPAGIPVVEAASIQSTNAVTVGAASVNATAQSITRGVSIAGILDIEEMTGDSSSTSDGAQGTPTSSLQVGQVTVAGIPAYIDTTGVHVDTTAAPDGGVTPAEAQSTLNDTLAQDGIGVRLVDPSTTTTGPDGHADAGGLVVSFTHAFDIPYIAGLPALPALPDVGSVGIPAGIYTVTSSITLGSAVTDATAALAPAFSGFGTPSAGIGGVGLGTLGTAGTPGGPGSLSAVPATPQSFAASGPGTAPTDATASSVVPATRSLFDELPFGVPAPVGWILAALAMCVLVTYPMLLVARWQFLGARRR